VSVITDEILSDIRQTLEATSAFSSVTLGADEGAARWPRAEVHLASVDEARPDDRADARWCALASEVCIYVRSTGPAEATQRLLDLVDTAQEALRADSFRGQRCRDLPIGAATVIGPTAAKPKVKPPYHALTFEVCCHFESQEDN